MYINYYIFCEQRQYYFSFKIYIPFISLNCIVALTWTEILFFFFFYFITKIPHPLHFPTTLIAVFFWVPSPLSRLQKFGKPKLHHEMFPPIFTPLVISSSLQALNFIYIFMTSKYINLVQIYILVVVQSLSHILLFATRLPYPSCLPEFAQTHVHWVSDVIQTSSSVTLFSSCLQSFPASGSFLMSCLFTSGSQSIGASASASVLPKNFQGWFPLGLTCLISLQSKGLSRVFSSTTVWKLQCIYLYLVAYLTCTLRWLRVSYDSLK